MLDLVSEPLEYPGGVQHGLPYGGRDLRDMGGGMGEDTDPEPSRITTDQSGQATRRKGAGPPRSPGAPPLTASSTAAVSRTVRVTTAGTLCPHLLGLPGPALIRPRLGFRPTR